MNDITIGSMGLPWIVANIEISFLWLKCTITLPSWSCMVSGNIFVSTCMQVIASGVYRGAVLSYKYLKQIIGTVIIVEHTRGKINGKISGKFLLGEIIKSSLETPP